MIHRIDATVLFVRDLAKCTTFYRDTLGLQVTNSDPDSVAFLLEDRYVLLAAGVEDVDAASEELKAKGVTFLRPPTNQPWGCARRTLPIPKATSGRSTSLLKRRRRAKRSRSVALFGHHSDGEPFSKERNDDQTGTEALAC